MRDHLLWMQHPDFSIRDKWNNSAPVLASAPKRKDRWAVFLTPEMNPPSAGGPAKDVAVSSHFEVQMILTSSPNSLWSWRGPACVKCSIIFSVPPLAQKSLLQVCLSRSLVINRWWVTQGEAGAAEACGNGETLGIYTCIEWEDRGLDDGLTWEPHSLGTQTKIEKDSGVGFRLVVSGTTLRGKRGPYPSFWDFEQCHKWPVHRPVHKWCVTGVLTHRNWE